MDDFEVSTLLIVDDEADVIKILQEIIHYWGHQTIVAKSCDEAFQVFLEQPVTAILADISMPGKTGIDLLKMIRSTGSEIPLAFLTAYDSKEYMKKAIQYGAVHFMEKPFDLHKLQECVHILLDLGRRLKAERVDRKMLNLLRLRMDRAS